MKKVLKLFMFLGASTGFSFNAVACSNSSGSYSDIPVRKTYKILFKEINKISISTDFLRFTLNKADVVEGGIFPLNFWLNGSTATDLNAREPNVMQKFATIYGFSLSDNWTTINNKLQTLQITNVTMAISDLDTTMWDLTDFTITN